MNLDINERVDPAEYAELKGKVVRTNKVQKTHKGGRTLSWSCLVVVGDGKGVVGCAIGKARGIPDAIRKGEEKAKKQLVRVNLLGTTIPHEVVCSHGSATVLLRPASPGTGVVAGSSVRAILEAAGLRDVLGKSLGSANPVNMAWATMKCLLSLKSPHEVARVRRIPVKTLMPWAEEEPENPIVVKESPAQVKPVSQTEQSQPLSISAPAEIPPSPAVAAPAVPASKEPPVEAPLPAEQSSVAPETAPINPEAQLPSPAPESESAEAAPESLEAQP